MRSSEIFSYRIVPAVLICLMGAACEDNPADVDDPGPGEEELITTVRVTFTNRAGGPDITVEFKDLDGEGGNAPTIGTLTLAAGATYDAQVTLLNEAESPAEDITEEVRDEAEEHQLFYEVRGGLTGRVTVDYADMESDYGANATGADLPVGLQVTVTVTAGAAVSGELNVVLSHYDDAPKNGTDRSSETDIDVTFPVNVN